MTDGPHACFEDFLEGPLPALNDPEGARVPAGLPPVVDAHVHLFPDRVFGALWRWFETHGWPVRYRLETPAIIEFLLSRGVDHIVALQYPHKPGMARALNQYLAEVVADQPQVTGLASVHPDDPDPRAILDEAFAAGLSGVKLHCHVQGRAIDDPALTPVFEACVAHDKPLIIHAGRAPRLRAYPVDPAAICHVDRTARVLTKHPDVRLCVPHLGADEYEGYGALLDRFENLWLDTTMVVADYLPHDGPWGVIEAHAGRLMYGTDFPNLPFAWDRELKKIVARGLPKESLAGILGENARRFYGLPEAQPATL